MDANKKWDFNLLRQNLQPQSAIDAVKTPISWSAQKDSIMWPHSKDGTYSVKSGYKALIDTTPNPVQKPSTSISTSEKLWKLVWTAKVPTKIKHFLWKICQDILPTRENLCKKRIPISHLCPVCLKDTETSEHLFLLCEWTKPLWFGLQFVTPPSPIGLSTIQKWILDALESPTALENNLSSWIFYTLWIIWNARNDMVFNNKVPKPLGSLHKVKALCSEFLSTSSLKSNTNLPRQPQHQVTLQAPPIQWRPPHDPFVKVNCDSAFEKTTGKGFSGIICRNSQGRLLTASTTRFFADSALVAEALCLREAVSFAVNLQFERVIFESDNKTLVEVCRNNLVRYEIQGIVEDINSLRSNFVESGITWTKREGNICAHTIAALARDDLLQGSWMLRPPPLLRRALVMDAQALWK